MLDHEYIKEVSRIVDEIKDREKYLLEHACNQIPLDILEVMKYDLSSIARVYGSPKRDTKYSPTQIMRMYEHIKEDPIIIKLNQDLLRVFTHHVTPLVVVVDRID